MKNKQNCDDIENQEYIIAGYGGSGYYYSLAGNSINMLVLVWSFQWLKNNPSYSPYTFQRYKDILLQQNCLLSEQEGLFDYATSSELDDKSNMVHILCNFPLNKELFERIIKQFPQYSHEFLENHEYIISLDNYLKVLEQFLTCYEQKITYIIVYADNNKIVHCKPYDSANQ